MKVLMTVVVVAAAAVIGLAYSGVYDVSASSPHSGFVRWLLATTADASIKRHARDIEVPDLDNEALVRAGVNDFSAMCAGCHGAPGERPQAVGLGLNPPPPDLSESAAHMAASELFWVTKHGIKMTGMPAWGATHDDEALWPVVAFLRVLPGLDAKGYEQLLASARGAGHHTPDHASDASGSHDDHDAQVPVSSDTTHDDGHDHAH